VNNKEHFQEVAVILKALRLSGITICFIDEYNVSEQDAQLYNWVRKGKQDYIFNQLRKPSMHIMAAVTDK
jgi:hypothetical protein